MTAARRGIVLVWALVTMAITTTILGSLASYYSSVGRFAKNYRDETLERFEGQRIVDSEMLPVLSQASDLLNSTLAAQPDVVGYDKLVDALKSALEAQKFVATDVGGTTVYQKVVDGQTLTVDSPDELTEQSGNKRKLHLEASFFVGGAPVTLRQEITFARETVSTLKEGTTSSHKSFDYVYFVNNYGHLETDFLIVNGSVHSNDRMTIDKATVNGFVSAYSNTITITNGKIWPERTYQARVAAEWGRKLTQVRPIDGNPFDWEGGYVPPLVLSPYVDDYSTVEQYPDVTEPTWPGDIPKFTLTKPNLNDYMPSEPVCTTTKEGVFKTTYYTWSYEYNGQTRSRKGLSKSLQKSYIDADRANDVKDANTRFNNALSYYTQKSNEYATVTLKPWNDYYAELEKYDNHDTDAEVAWRSRRDTYYQQRDTWNTDLANGTMVTDLKDAVSLSGQKMVDDKAGYVEMLNLSRPDNYRQYCIKQQGTLRCRNCYKDENGVEHRIAWKNPSQFDICYMMVRTYLLDERLRGYWSDWRLDETVDKLIWSSSSIWTQESQHPFMRELASIDIISNGYQAVVYPFNDYDSPCSYNANFSRSALSSRPDPGQEPVNYGSVSPAVKEMEKGSVILIGSYDYPIIINGPVFFDGDVVIRGFVSGQGTIYSARNIHIVGDIVYRKPGVLNEMSYCGTKIKGPPSWAYDSTGAGGKRKIDFVTENKECDLLLLAARGNIIVGDYSSAEWQKATNMKWLKCPNGVSPVGNTYEDSLIGYQPGHSDYTVFDRGMKVDLVRMTTPYATPLYYKIYKEEPTPLAWADHIWYYGETVHATNLTNRAFYQCTLGDHVITGLKQKGDGSDFSSISPVDFNNSGSTHDGFIVPAASKVKTTVTQNRDAADITQIDAALFAGHGIFGVVGGTYGHKFTLNGAMICRDEGLFPSFETRFKTATNPSPKIWLNWDLRIKSDNDSGNQFVAVGPDCPGSTSTTTKFNIYISDWQQVR